MIYCVIPARSGSKGVKDKNIKLLNNIPLLVYSIITSLLIKEIDKCIVTTDSSKYIDIVKKYSNVSTIIRPECISKDNSMDIDYLLHIIYQLNLKAKDLIILLRPTTPLRNKKIIKDAIKKFKKNLKEFDSLRSIHELDEPPEKMFKLSAKNKLISYFNINQSNLPRQHFQKAYHPNGYVDIIKVETLLKTKTTYGQKIFGYITEKVIEIDSIEDFKYLEYVSKKGKK